VECKTNLTEDDAEKHFDLIAREFPVPPGEGIHETSSTIPATSFIYEQE
jgi:hypothetical protein